MMPTTVQKATCGSEVLLIHAPYPGKLKFRGVPSSMLAAAAPFLQRGPHVAGYLDPVSATESFYKRLSRLLLEGQVRAVCISTSTAAIEEAARIASLAATHSPGSLVVAGGPHDDDCSLKMALRIPEVDVSLGGSAEFALDFILTEWLERREDPRQFCRQLPARLSGASLPGGRFTLASRWFPDRALIHAGSSPIPSACLPAPVLPAELPRFEVFGGAPTIPLMISRGCPYGRCTFCAEAIRGDGFLVHENFDWLFELIESRPGAAVYFQDSIFPMTRSVREQLLPGLRSLGVRWGAQAFLGTLTHRHLDELAESGCRYLYTGLESASETVLAGVGKHLLSRELALQKVAWIRDAGLSLGASLMFGSMTTSGELLESPATVRETLDLAAQIGSTNVDVAGFYPNVQTVLPGTPLALGLSRSGLELDFYRMPRAEVFESLEDGGVGYNFLTSRPPRRETWAVAEAIRDAAASLADLSRQPAQIEGVVAGGRS